MTLKLADGDRKRPAYVGACKHPLYRRWGSMVARCYNKNEPRYPDYGGRGITMCTEWLQDFSTFVRDMGDPPFEGATVDRKDNDLPYCKSNCVWSTSKQQARNRRDTLLVTYKNETRPLIEFAELVGMPYGLVKQRFRRDGWSIDKALETPAREKRSCL